MHSFLVLRCARRSYRSRYEETLCLECHDDVASEQYGVTHGGAMDD